MWVVSYNLKVLKLVIIYVLRLAFKNKLRKCSWLTSKLELYLFNMIQVNMSITHSNHNLTNTQITLLGQHMS